MNLLNFIKRIFQPKSFINGASVADVAPQKKSRQPFTKPYGRWVNEQLKDYDGTGPVIVKVPAGMSMKKGQNSVSSHIQMRFGKGKFRTRRYDTARTVHVRPL